MKKIFTAFFFFIIIPMTVEAFVSKGDFYAYRPAGFLNGIWHGLLAPYTLVVRWFINDIIMYAFSNTGWWYDLGFLTGAVLSIPFGWLFAIFSFIGHLIF